MHATLCPQARIRRWPSHNIITAQHYGLNHPHYLTTSTYRRARVFDSQPFKLKFVGTLDELRADLGFRIHGYALMPEHCIY
jgi:REP element-mobilizing transposase RayT